MSGLLLALIVTCLIILGFTRLSSCPITHPAGLFSLLWLAVLVLYAARIYPIYDVKDEIASVLFFMITSFSVGVLLGSIYCHSRRNNARRIGTYRLRNVVFLCACAISFLVMMYDQRDVLSSLLGGSSFENLVSTNGGAQTVTYSGAVQIGLYTFIIWPITYCVSPVCAAEFFGKESKRGIYLVVNIAVVAAAALHHGGRAPIIIMGLSYILVYLLNGKKSQLTRRAKRNLLILLIVGGAFVLLLSLSRGIDDIVKSFYCYFIGGIPIAQANLSSIVMETSDTWGCLSFYGFAFPLFTVFRYLGFPAFAGYTKAEALTTLIDSNYVNIGLGYGRNEYNAFMPAGVYPYIEGGFVFEIVVMMIYGFVCMISYTLAMTKPSVRSHALYAFLAYGFVLSFTRFYFASVGYAVGLLYILFVLYEPSKKDSASKEEACPSTRIHQR